MEKLDLEKKVIISCGVLVLIIIITLVSTLNSGSSSFRTFDKLDPSAAKEKQAGEVAGIADQQSFGPPAPDASAEKKSPTEAPSEKTSPTPTPEPTHSTSSGPTATPTQAPQPTNTPAPTQVPTSTPEPTQEPTSAPTMAP